jgi:adenylate/nucleoside-diphosphate kinase
VRSYRRYEGLEPGSQDHVAEYNGRLYSMKGEDELRAFMREPTTYAAVELPQKLPPPAQPLSVAALPMLGYMEQTVATAVTQALTQVGLKRPHHPFLSSKQSALLHIALHLKSSNPR